MLSARGSRLKKFKKAKSKKGILLKKLLFLGVILAFITYLFIRSYHFYGQDKIVVVSPSADEVIVTTFDRGSRELTSVKIPGDTEVSVARQLGVWRIKSVWQLGVNEGVGGKLLAETVTKNFKFPVIAWTDSQGLGLTEEGLGSFIKAIFYPYDSNLGFGDKVSMALLTLMVRNFDRVEVDLAESSYLKHTRLKDGNEGYIIFGQMPQSLIVVFADNKIAEKGVRIILKNASGDGEVALETAKVFETLGGKVAANIDVSEQDLNCVVTAKVRDFAQNISYLFGCEVVIQEPEGNFDVEVTVGKEFARRF